RNLDLLLLTLAFTGSAVGVGGLALRPLRMVWHDEWENALFALAIGLALYTFAVMALGWAGLFGAVPLGLVLVVGIALTVFHAATVVRRPGQRPVSARPAPSRRPLPVIVGVLLAIAVAVAAYIALLGALGPEAQFDARWNHLAVPAHYVAHGGFFPIVKVTRM